MQEALRLRPGSARVQLFLGFGSERLWDLPAECPNCQIQRKPWGNATEARNILRVAVINCERPPQFNRFGVVPDGDNPPGPDANPPCGLPKTRVQQPLPTGEDRPDLLSAVAARSECVRACVTVRWISRGQGHPHNPDDLKGRLRMLITYCLAGWLACTAPSEPLDRKDPSPVTDSVLETSDSRDVPTKTSSALYAERRTVAIPPEPSEPTTLSPRMRRDGRTVSRTAARVQAMVTVRPGHGVPVPRLVACSSPPWFEDSNLERSGKSSGDLLQPFVSGVHFFGSVGVLPLKVLQAGPHTVVCPQDDVREFAPVSRVRNLLSPAPGFEPHQSTEQVP